MAQSNVTINVKSNLLSVADHLKIIADSSKSVMQNMKDFGKKTDDTVSGQSRNMMHNLNRLQNAASTIAKKMGDSFKAMFSAMGVAQGLKMGGIFGDSIKESFALSDQIRKLSTIFEIAETRFVAFQAKLVKGLGEIGISSEAATNALKGLAETQVRGEEQLIEYSKLAGQLASIGQQQGQEGEIAKGIAGVITERGGDPSDVGEAKRVAEDVRKTVSATGMKPTEILAGMQKLFQNMDNYFKKNISTKGLMQLAVIQKTGGEETTNFLQDYLSKGYYERQIPGARGLEDIFDENGLNVPKFKKAMKEIFDTIPEDMKLAAQTLGVDETTARGLIQLYKSLDKVDAAQKKVQADTKNLNQVYMQSMGALEAFTASLNKFKASLSEEVAIATNWITDALKKGFSSSLSDLTKSILPESVQKKVEEVEKSLPDVLGKNLGSTLVVGGTALASGLLFGGGLTNLLKGKATGAIEKKTAEEVFGVTATPVYIVNTGELAAAIGGQGGGAAPGATSAAGLLSTTLAVATAAIAGYTAAQGLNDVIKEYQPDFMNKSDEAIDKFFQRLANYVWAPKVEPIYVDPKNPGGPARSSPFATNQAGLSPSTNKATGKTTP